VNHWLFAAYSSVFVLLLGYLLFLSSRLERLSSEIEDLREELASVPRDGAGTDSEAPAMSPGP
jgi:CcmD family protein